MGNGIFFFEWEWVLGGGETYQKRMMTIPIRHGNLIWAVVGKRRRSSEGMAAGKNYKLLILVIRRCMMWFADLWKIDKFRERKVKRGKGRVHGGLGGVVLGERAEKIKSGPLIINTYLPFLFFVFLRFFLSWWWWCQNKENETWCKSHTTKTPPQNPHQRNNTPSPSTLLSIHDKNRERKKTEQSNKRMTEPIAEESKFDS